jgi:hypothetical protein
MRRAASTEARRLLRLLLVWIGRLPADPRFRSLLREGLTGLFARNQSCPPQSRFRRIEKLIGIHRLPREAVELVGGNLVEIDDVERQSRKAMENCNRMMESWLQDHPQTPGTPSQPEPKG